MLLSVRFPFSGGTGHTVQFGCFGLLVMVADFGANWALFKGLYFIFVVLAYGFGWFSRWVGLMVIPRG